MKKNILLLFVLSASAFSATAQQFTFNPSPQGVDKQGPASEFELVGYAFVKNTSPSTKTYVWKMIRNNFPAGWSSAVCDINLCYSDQVLREEFQLNAGDSGNIDVHLYPNNVQGNASVSIKIFEKGDSLNCDTQDFEFSTWALSVSNLHRNNIEIYPNPVSKKLTINLETTKAVTIEVYNVLGQVKKTHVHNGGTSTLDVNDLAAGIYFIRYTTEQGKVVSKQFKKIN